MAKRYSFVDLPKPLNCTATPIAGGTLSASTTYYYRVIGTYSSHTVYWYGKSKSSDEFSATTTSTDKSITLTWDSPIGENNYYRVFRATTSGGMLNSNSSMIYTSISDATYNSGGTVTWTDDGSIALRDSNYCFEIDNDCHGRLTLSGSTSGDHFSIVDLYDADQTNEWGVITRSSPNVFKINCHLIKHTGLYWTDTRKTIEFCEGMSGSSTDNYFNFGSISGSALTSNGCNLIFNSPWLTTITFGELYAYRTTFACVNAIDSNMLGLSFSSGLVQDCTVDNSRSFACTGNLAGTFRNLIFSRFDNFFSAYSANFDGVRALRGSRVWQIAGGGKNITARGVFGDGCLACLCVNATSTSSLTIIDSEFTYASPLAGNYSRNEGFMYYDQFSYNLTVYERDSVTPIEGAVVTLWDNTEEIFSVSTDVNGQIAEQFVTRKEGTVTSVTGTSVYSYIEKSPFKILITKTDRENYVENFPQATSTAIVKTVAMDDLGSTVIYDSTLTDVTLY